MTNTHESPSIFGADEEYEIGQEFAGLTKPDVTAPSAPVEHDDPFAAMKAEAEVEPESYKTYENTVRPNWALRMSVTMGARELQRYRNTAMGKSKDPAKADPLRGNVLLLAEKNTEILYKGKVVDLPDNEGPLKVTSHEFVKTWSKGAGTVMAALQNFMGDALIVSIANSVVDEAGYGEGADPIEDPQNG